jgi:hypothetical protein
MVEAASTSEMPVTSTRLQAQHPRKQSSSRFQFLSTVSLCNTQKEPLTIFIYSIFNDVFCISHYITSNERMIVNNELERIWKEAVVA